MKQIIILRKMKKLFPSTKLKKIGTRTSWVYFKKSVCSKWHAIFAKLWLNLFIVGIRWSKKTLFLTTSILWGNVKCIGLKKYWT